MKMMKKVSRHNIYDREYYQRVERSHKEYSRKNYDPLADEDNYWQEELDEDAAEMETEEDTT
jgi:hypothetical protein